ncbi:hypothetical protein CEXT_601381 [Caerostris extrusa]|uniref:Uncharacterized protein n=1 Tax=Caerostris extrusa TaxID=172846 RepID=A0AAV4XF82_CAEEX|nr:hypothetical protein CEXT_601381 [Caerostris extrusa]
MVKVSVFILLTPSKTETATNPLHFWVVLFTISLFEAKHDSLLFTRLIEELRRVNDFVEREQRLEFESVQIYADLEPLLATLEVILQIAVANSSSFSL